MAPEYYVFTGRERVPVHITHVIIAKALKFVRAWAFASHPYRRLNIVEVICHDGVEKIEQAAFKCCPSLKRVIMPGVKEVEDRAFHTCEALTYIECGKLERIGEHTFCGCLSLNSIDLPSIHILERSAFAGCPNLINVKVGKDLESIGNAAFIHCFSLERIALPLKDGVITKKRIFQECKNLNHVDLVGGVHETIAALLMEEWKNDMNEKIDAINRILATTSAGSWDEQGEKGRKIRRWIRSVLRKIVDYKAEHRRYLNVAATTLQPALPNDIVLKNVLPFLELPSYTFEGEN